MAWVLHPSHAHRWARCPAAPRMAQYGIDRGSTTADEGKAAHWLASMVLTGEVGDVSELIDRRDPDGHAITGGIADNTDIHIQYVQQHAATPIVEKLMGSILPSISDVCPDVWWLDETADILEIVDFKYGFRPVEVVGNYQLLLGAWAAIYMMTHTPTMIRLTIVQPRLFTGGDQIQTWEIDYNELDRQITALNDLAILTQAPDAPTVAGEIQCRYCPAIHCCPASRAAGLSLLDVAEQGAPEFVDNFQLRAEQVQLKRAVELGKMRIEAIENQLIDSLRKGSLVKGIAIGAGQGNRKWTVTPEQLAIAGKMHGVNLLEQKPITPAAAIRAGLPEHLLSVLTTRGSTAPKIVDIDLTKKAKEAFK